MTSGARSIAKDLYKTPG